MSGHSKWSQIKHTKGVADQRRGQLFSKLANAITLAARAGGDPEMNFQLRMAIDKARENNMPKDNIQRAIDRATGAGGQARFEEVLFEVYGPDGIAFLVETATDNRNRTTGEIRAVLNRNNGKLAESGSVSYLFEKRGSIIIPADHNAEEIELSAIDAGATDVEVSGNQVFISTKPTELEQVRRQLIDTGLTLTESNLTWEPLSPIMINDPAAAEKLIRLSEALEELDDATRVASNFDIPEELIN